jgi:azurin
LRPGEVDVDLIAANADPDRESADPYIVALAHQLKAEGYDVAVASNDRIYRPPNKLSISTACSRLEITVWSTETFIEWVRRCRDDRADGV